MQVVPLVAKFGTNARDAILWTILQLMQIAPPCDQNWNQCKFLAGEITQVKEAIPWVRCASGNVWILIRPKNDVLQHALYCMKLQFIKWLQIYIYWHKCSKSPWTLKRGSSCLSSSATCSCWGNLEARLFDFMDIFLFQVELTMKYREMNIVVIVTFC